jgi:hypothetical protein
MGLGSGIPDPGVKKAPDPGSRSAELFPNATTMYEYSTIY